MRKLLLFLAAALLPAGCTTTVAGSPRAVPSPAHVAPVHHVDPSHVTAEDALGDITTVSPCSLLQLTGLPSRFGTAELLNPDNIDNCWIYEPGRDGDGDGSAMVASVGILEDYATASQRGVKRFLSRPGGIRIAVVDDDDQGCDELLVFADTTTLDASVWPVKDTGEGMCDLATQLLDQVIDTVTGDGPQHRQYANNSLAHQDACALLTAADAGLAGVGAMHRIARYPARHRCLYEGTGDHRVQVELDFAVHDQDDDATGWTSAVIGGRTSMVEPDPHPEDGSSTYCVVMTEHQPITSAGPGDPVEDAELTVRVESGQPVPCDQAKQIAGQVWPGLPSPN